MDLTSPFFSNLRDVNISECNLSVPYLVSIAGNTSFLEQLTVTATRVIANGHPRHQIHFPRLRYLRYVDQNFLKYVDISQECALSTSCLWSASFDAIANIIPKLIYDYTHKGNPWLTIEISNIHCEIHNDINTGLFVELGEGDNQRWRIVLQDIFSQLATILPMITRLNFECHVRKGSGWEDLGPFLRNFTSVRTLHFERSNWCSIFPSLK